MQELLTIPVELRALPRVNFSTVFNDCNVSEIHWSLHKGLGLHLPSVSSMAHDKSWDIQKKQAQLEFTGATILRGLLPANTCKLIASTFFNSGQKVFKTDEKLVNRTATHNAPFSHFIHQLLTPLARQIIPTKIIPSYTFTSCYEKGSGLPMHVDSRPACTWNMSIIIDTSHPALVNSWPLIITGKKEPILADLGIGDCVIYSGTAAPHGRTVMPPEIDWVLGLFCHFAPENWTGSLD